MDVAHEPAATAEANKAVARRYFEELMGRGDLAVADEILAEQINVKGTPAARETFKDLAALLRRAFPDWRNTVEEQFADGDAVIRRVTSRGAHRGAYMGIPPSGVQAQRTGIFIFRVRDGRIVEIWDEIDQLGFLRQLGATLAPPEAPGHG